MIDIYYDMIEEIINTKYDKKMMVDLSFVDKDTIRRLNKDYRGLDKPTDVLSFSMVEGEYSELAGDILGDVIICEDIVLENSRENGVSFEEELLRVIAHGTLHLIGYTHDKQEDYKSMVDIQESFVKKYIQKLDKEDD
ncbi:MAG: rRNA maturation RNase YbeY [Candidatus Muiribacterium halophilum]|mgnify:CR=1 FL=1|uniref:Endoribonuclease YbeY n=1 Tax=Muiribacterium halophilum TaxID=2053465 RepID=A0A2N5ZMX3_MUIH1|nr:MAG: rRNA maturation RNase YbeY [Candidatus Muirbacterium halophilum]